jgi:hypothetical protein
MYINVQVSLLPFRAALFLFTGLTACPYIMMHLIFVERGDTLVLHFASGRAAVTASFNLIEISRYVQPLFGTPFLVVPRQEKFPLLS